MPGRWKQYYFEQISAAVDAGPAGQTAIRKLSPMTFVVSDLCEAIGWSLVAGVGTVALHGALTAFETEKTLTWGIGATGAALLAPLFKDGVVSVMADIAELLERRRESAPPRY